MYSFSGNCAGAASVPTSTFMCLLAIYIFPVHIFPAAELADRSWEHINRSQTDTWIWKLGLLPRSSFSGNICFEFAVLVLCSVRLRDTQPTWQRWRRAAGNADHILAVNIVAKGGGGRHSNKVRRRWQVRISSEIVKEITASPCRPACRFSHLLYNIFSLWQSSSMYSTYTVILSSCEKNAQLLAYAAK